MSETTLKESDAFKAQRPELVENVNRAEAALDAAQKMVRQHGADYGRLTNLKTELTAADDSALEEDAIRYLAGKSPLEDVAASNAKRKNAISFVNSALLHVADTQIPRANLRVREIELALAEARASVAILDEKVTQAELVELSVPAAASQGKVSINSEALVESRKRSAMAASTAETASKALADEIARQEAARKARASRGFVGWTNPD